MRCDSSRRCALNGPSREPTDGVMVQSATNKDVEDSQHGISKYGADGSARPMKRNRGSAWTARPTAVTGSSWLPVLKAP